MRAEQYINQLENKLKHQFNVYAKDQLGSLPLRFSAHYFRRDERYMMTKDVKVWSVENNQHFFLYENEKATKESLDRFKHELDAYIHKHRADRSSHMSSVYIGLFFVKEAPDADLIKRAKRSRKVSFIKWGMHGWNERYIAILSLDSLDVYMNPKGRPFIEPFVQSIKTNNEVGK